MKIATRFFLLALVICLFLITLASCENSESGDTSMTDTVSDTVSNTVSDTAAESGNSDSPAAESTWLVPSDYEDPDKDHVHTFSDSWSFNSAGHWHAATCNHPFERSGYAGHTGKSTEYPAGCVTYAYSIGTCSVCGYQGDTTHFDSLPGHKYVNGVCTVCSAKQPAFGSYTVRFHPQDADVYTVEINYDGTVQSMAPVITYMRTCQMSGTVSAWSFKENSPVGIDPNCWVPEYLDLYPIAHDVCVHEYATAKETPATCTESAAVELVCVKCGHRKTETVGEPLGHEIKNSVCVRCGLVGVTYPVSGTVTLHHESVTEALDYSLNNENDLAEFQRSVYNRLLTILEHDLRSFIGWKIAQDATEKYRGDWYPSITDYYLIDRNECQHPQTRSETQAPTCTAEGAERAVCTLCGACASETPIAKLPHKYVNGVCSECGLREGEYVHGTYHIQTYRSDGSLYRGISFNYDGVSFDRLQSYLDTYNEHLRGNGWTTEPGSKTPFTANQWTPDVTVLYNIPKDPVDTAKPATTDAETSKTWPAGTYDVTLHQASGGTVTVKIDFDGRQAGRIVSTLTMYQALCGAKNGWSTTPDGLTRLEPTHWTPEYLDLYPLNP